MGTQPQSLSHSQAQKIEPHRAYLGFDRNIYPGDDALPLLRKTFSFTGYWLSPPPGQTTNTWMGKREILRKNGFGFAVLFRGREQKDLKSLEDASAKGEEDALATVEAAQREGFGHQTIIYLDIEEGGRLSPAYHAYLRAWRDSLTTSGFRPGVYCSGMRVKESHSDSITTADDVHDDDATHDFVFWVFNVACLPSPGCAFPENRPSPAKSSISYASIWQYAQSPRRKEFTAHCPANYYPDGNCYAPGDTQHAWFLDVNTATSPDPSGGAK